MSKVKLGKKVHKVKRFTTKGEWVDGEWVDGIWEEIDIYANIQPAFSFYQTQLLPEGDRDKEAIWGSSNHWVYTASSSSSNNRQPDYIIYRGVEWEVKATMPYGNLGEHVEFVAIRSKEVNTERLDGDIEDVT